MTERTLNEEELGIVLDSTQGVSRAVCRAVMEAAFPPLFKATFGEVIVVSDYSDFRNSKVRVFCKKSKQNSYECFSNGNLDGDTIPWKFAKSQTEKHKGQ
jgi:hypothetical protein